MIFGQRAVPWLMNADDQNICLEAWVAPVSLLFEPLCFWFVPWKFFLSTWSSFPPGSHCFLTQISSFTFMSDGHTRQSGFTWCVQCTCSSSKVLLCLHDLSSASVCYLFNERVKAWKCFEGKGVLHVLRMWSGCKRAEHIPCRSPRPSSGFLPSYWLQCYWVTYSPFSLSFVEWDCCCTHGYKIIN